MIQSNENDAESDVKSDAEPKEKHSASTNRSLGREKKKPERFADIDFDDKKKRIAKLARILSPTITEPQSFHEAVEHPLYRKPWKEAINDEYIVKKAIRTMSTRAYLCLWNS